MPASRKYKERFNRLLEYGCIVCKHEYGVYSYPEIHHLRHGRGVGQKKDHSMTIPLCPTHHRTGGLGEAFHAGQKTWESYHETEVSLLRKINEWLER